MAYLHTSLYDFGYILYLNVFKDLKSEIKGFYFEKRFETKKVERVEFWFKCIPMTEKKIQEFYFALIIDANCDNYFIEIQSEMVKDGKMILKEFNPVFKGTKQEIMSMEGLVLSNIEGIIIEKLRLNS